LRILCSKSASDIKIRRPVLSVSKIVISVKVKLP